MKKIIICTIALLTCIGLSAQHETLFNNARVVGGFGGPIFEYGLNDKVSNAAGGGGGIVINNFFIGGYGMANFDLEEVIESDDFDNLEMAHGGFWLGGTYRPHSILHFYGSARAGWGALNIDVSDNNNQDFEDLDKIFVFTPEIGVELNITRWFRVAGTVGYRLVDGANENFGYKNEDFSGTVAGVTLRFGWFGWRR